MAGKAAKCVVKTIGEYQYPWREKLVKYKDELSKGVWGYWELGAWKQLGLSARRRARLRKEVLLAGEDWPYDPARKEMRNKRKGHKCDRISAEKRAHTAELMKKMPEMLLDYKKRREDFGSLELSLFAACAYVQGALMVLHRSLIFSVASTIRYMMEAQSQDSLPPRPRVKATLNLSSEIYSVNATKGILSAQLVSMKEESMSILKDFITKHNVPNDVPDEAVESSSEDDGEAPEKPAERPKKRK
ncbi:hypothetical protein HHK36_002923 [Tetracentron sinense]|uniref:Uncharacterized protein n=1 Tax=Tetracentron sinense TaxID=13715 RepID=A0A834ZMW2_TETSI|nr:hypothetical protein HHK36_002923 [Tetracentron sinense]